MKKGVESAFSFAMFVVIATLLVQLGGLTAMPDVAAKAAPDPDFADAVWVGRSGEALRVAAASGEVVLTVDDSLAVQALAVDEAAGRVYLFGDDTLRAVDFDGTAMASVPTGLGVEEAPHLVAAGGVVWLGSEDVLYRFEANGVLTATLPLPGVLRDLALDGPSGVVWAATEAGAVAFDAAGVQVGFVDADRSGAWAVAVDRASGALWLATKDTLARYAADGVLELEVVVKNLRHLSADGAGGVWAAGQQALFRFAADGTAVVSLDPLRLPGNVAGLAADPADGGAWVATQQRLLHVSAAGNAIRELRMNGGSTTDLALYTDLLAPGLAFVAPAEGATIVGQRPAIELAWSDVGQGVDPASLLLTIQGSQLAADCQEIPGGTVCQPLVDLPLGELTLTATVADFAGNFSTPATVSFTLVPPNLPPVLAPIGDQTIAAGSTLVLTLEASDPNDDVLTFSASPLPLPTGSLLDSAAGVFTFKPSARQAGDHVVTFSVSDGEESVSETVTITVLAPQPGQPSAVTGRLLDTADFLAGIETPIVGATVSVAGVTSATGADGRFLASGVASGEQVLFIDSTTAAPAPDGSLYASFAEAIEILPGLTLDITRPLFLPRIDASSLTTVDPAATTVVTNPGLAVSVTVPPATAKLPDGSNFTGQLSLSEVPQSLAPVNLPEELDPALLLTLQPTGVSFSTPVPLTMPNLDGMPPGSELDLWSVDPATGLFEIVGVGRVSADGSVVETISGGIRTASWHAMMGPQPGSNGDDNNGDNQDPDKCDDCNAGSSTALSSGNLSVVHDLPIYYSLNRPRSLRLVYNSETADPRPTVKSRTTIPVRAAVPPLVSAGVEIGGIDLGPQLVTDTTGLSESRDETILQAVQIDGSALATGSYPYRLRLTSRYAQSSISSFQGGNVLVHNQRTSSVGAGWGIAGVERLHVQGDRSVVLANENGSIQRFAPALSVDNGLEARFFNISSISSVGNGFAGLTPGTFTVRTAAGSASAGSFVFPVVNFPDNGFDGSAFYNVGPNGFIDPGSGSTSPRGDDVSVTPPGGNDTFGVQFSGFLFLPEGGDVTFTVGVDDAFDLIVDGVSVVRFIGGTNFRTFTGTANLPAGVVPITLNYGEISGEANIVLGASGGGLPGGVIPPSFLFVEEPDDVGLPDAFVSPAGDFSALRSGDDGTFTRTLKDGSVHRFDAAGRKVAAIDVTGDSTTYDYDARGRLVRVTDPAGLATVLAYAGDHLASVTDPAGRPTAFTHDAAGNLVRITDADGTFRELVYDERHRLAAQRTKRGFETTYAYDFAGRNVGVVRPDGSLRQIQPKDSIGLPPPESGLTTPVVRPEDAVGRYFDGNGNARVFDTDRFGASVRTVDPDGTVTTAVRDANGNPTRVTNSNGSTQDFTFDDVGNLLSLRQTGSGGEAAQEVRFEYEPVLNRVTRITDPDGNELTIDYDAAGNPIRLVDATGAVTTAVYDGRGQVTSATDANGNTTTFAYDANGNTETITDARGVVTLFTRDAAGRVTAVTQALGLAEERTTSFTYDARNRLLTVTDPEGGTTRNVYDASGNVIEVVSPTGEVIASAYDSLGRLIREDHPIRGTTLYAYDGNGNLVEVTDAAGAVTRLEYDVRNRLVRSIDAAGGEQRYAYDGRGNLTSFTDALDRTWSSAYDRVDRLVSQTDPLGRTMTLAYDRRNFLISTTDARGNTSSFTYDALGRLLETQTPDDLVRRTYDAMGHLTSIEDGDSRLAFRYDELNRPFEVEVVDVGVQPGAILTSSFDAVGNRTLLADSSGGATAFTHDRNSRPTSITTPAGATVAMSHDPLGRLNTMSLPNGVDGQRGYDASGRLTDLDYLDGSGTVLVGFDYLYDTLGKLIRIAEGTQVRDFSYDALERLLAGGTSGLPETYAYDGVGNRVASFLSSTYLYDAANQLVEDDRNTYVHDAAGNLVEKRDKASGEATLYTWDSRNRLERADFPDGTAAAYRYDALGRRIEKDVDGVITRYVYDGSDILLELDGTNALAARYTHGPGIDQHLVMERGGVTYTYLTDHQGSVRALVDAAGTAVNSYDYDSFGRLLTSSETVANPYGYTGREFDPETGLHYYRARYYDPELGRFLGRDPLGIGGGSMNLYAYVGSDPVNRTDPSGLLFWDLVDVGFFLWSLNDFIECPGLGTGFWLALDTLSLLPIVPSAGWAGRADDVLDAVNHSDEFFDVANRSDEFSDLANRGDDLLNNGPGANITPQSSIDNYDNIGRDGTFVTDQRAIEDVIGPIGSGADRIQITPDQARQLEDALGLNPNSLESSNVLSLVDDIAGRSPSSPITGNDFFLGPGQGLPGGGPELVIESIPSSGGPGITQIIVEVVP